MDLDELRRAGITPAAEVPGYPHHVVGFGDLDEDLPPIASQLLADLLPGYAEARRKWPLWTYECRHPREVPFHRFRKAATWHGTRSWADRLAFSPAYLLGAVEEASDRWRNAQPCRAPPRNHRAGHRGDRLKNPRAAARYGARAGPGAYGC